MAKAKKKPDLNQVEEALDYVRELEGIIEPFVRKMVRQGHSWTYIMQIFEDVTGMGDNFDEFVNGIFEDCQMPMSGSGDKKD